MPPRRKKPRYQEPSMETSFASNAYIFREGLITRSMVEKDGRNQMKAVCKECKEEWFRADARSFDTTSHYLSHYWAHHPEIAIDEPDEEQAERFGANAAAKKSLKQSSIITSGNTTSPKPQPRVTRKRAAYGPSEEHIREELTLPAPGIQNFENKTESSCPTAMATTYVSFEVKKQGISMLLLSAFSGLRKNDFENWLLAEATNSTYHRGIQRQLLSPQRFEEFISIFGLCKFLSSFEDDAKILNRIPGKYVHLVWKYMEIFQPQLHELMMIRENSTSDVDSS